MLADTLPKGDLRSGFPCSHLNDIVFSIFAVDSFDSADVKTSKHFRAGVCPESVPAETREAWPRISCRWVVHQIQPPVPLPVRAQRGSGALLKPYEGILHMLCWVIASLSCTGDGAKKKRILPKASLHFRLFQSCPQSHLKNVSFPPWCLHQISSWLSFSQAINI